MGSEPQKGFVANVDGMDTLWPSHPVVVGEIMDLLFGDRSQCPHEIRNATCDLVEHGSTPVVHGGKMEQASIPVVHGV